MYLNTLVGAGGDGNDPFCGKALNFIEEVSYV